MQEGGARQYTGENSQTTLEGNVNAALDTAWYWGCIGESREVATGYIEMEIIMP